MLDSNQPKEQTGLQFGYSTTDHILVNQVMKKYAECFEPLCMAFIDREKVLDPVEMFRKWGGDICESIQRHL